MASRLLNGKFVLVVEDETLVAMDVEEALQQAGAYPSVAATCQEALRLIGERRFDLAVLDINLGQEKTFPVARELRRVGTSFIFVTGYERAQEEFAKSLLLQKPVSSYDIVLALHTLAL